MDVRSPTLSNQTLNHRKSVMKETLKKIGGLISAVTLIAFALYLMAHDVKLNIATWVLWTLLDIILVMTGREALLRQGKNEWPWLPIGWTTGAAIVTIILLTRGQWQWTWTETLTVIVTAIAAGHWRATSNARAGIVAATLAMTVAGIPSAMLAWNHPDPSSWWLWAGVSVSCFFTLAGTKEWSIEERFLPVASFMFNGLMTALVLL